MSADFDGYNEVHTHEIRTARKEHTCYACHETIRPGHKYALDKCLYDGYWQKVKRCARCETIYRHLCTLNWNQNEGPQWDLGCGHEYKEVHGVDPPPEIAELAFLNQEEAQERLT